MTLNCSAQSCVYNKTGICYAGSIRVIGDNANSSSQTKCSTFTLSDGNQSFSNNTSNTFTTSSDIDCAAKKCIYNSHNTCTANSVYIDINNASCNTFLSK